MCSDQPPPTSLRVVSQVVCSYAYAHVINKGNPRPTRGICQGTLKRMDRILCPWEGENSQRWLKVNAKGRANSKFCKTADGNYVDVTGILAFPSQ